MAAPEVRSAAEASIVSVMESAPPAEPDHQNGEVADIAVHLAPPDDLEQGHRQCMEILVRQECGRERCEEQLEELKVKLHEETQRREQLDLEVARLSVRSQVLKENAEKHEEQMRAMVEEKNELKRRYDELLTDSQHLHEEKTSLKQKCDDQYEQLEEWMQETATGSSRAEESAEESSVLSSEEASNAKDQEGSDSVPMNHLPEPVDPSLHTGVDLPEKTAEQHRMEDEESLQETAVGSSPEEDCALVGSTAEQSQSEKPGSQHQLATTACTSISGKPTMTFLVTSTAITGMTVAMATAMAMTDGYARHKQQHHQRHRQK
ncbi:hypothetical protein AK812_SmicGene23898 [Symbiodinium microadriaticum]|uniref:Uncharacterized protein n=1 Tax=Symbiodinium microadriaticum TaxID=2951 RepID=A0A1Q9DG40_SYMMI|nr:hypothetical protein AK812_SmicGene23898 [Symbiodinium microadriaticum]